MISTVSEFIKALGGTQKAALAFGVVKGAVSNWRRANRFSPLGAVRAMGLASANNLIIHPDIYRRAGEKEPVAASPTARRTAEKRKIQKAAKGKKPARYGAAAE